MSMDNWWNVTNRGKLKYSEKSMSKCPSVHHKCPWTDVGSNPGLRGGRPASYSLSHGTALGHNYNS
jgi:hypothetical protein